MNDDGMHDMFNPVYMPLFSANWASQFIDCSQNTSGTSELCAPARASTMSGKYAEHHGVTDNDLSMMLDTSNTFFVAAANAGCYVGGVGKYMNGWGESGGGGYGSPGGIPGLHYQRFTYGGLPVYNYEICDENGNITPYGDAEADYIVDVEKTNVLAFYNNAPVGRQTCMYWAPRAPHTDICAPRHISAPMAPPNPPAFGVDPNTLGWPAFMIDAATLPWDSAQNSAQLALNIAIGRTMLAQDEAVHAVFTRLVELGMWDSTLVMYLTDNGASTGQGCLEDKGTPHRSAAQLMLRVKLPGTAGGTTRSHAFSNVDIAPTICEWLGAKMPKGCDGMSMLPALRNAAAAHRKYSYLSMPTKPPQHSALWRNDGVLYYRGEGPLLGQHGSWADVDMTTNTGFIAELDADLSAIRDRI